ncbi:hypothetical protein ANCCAN_21113 [Ancylostoma caninum]|uniref:Uncharacterized protein n=1 Tax=Ancylostoma caninum TaxID=29170 RepID=A0A368FLF1_ANCCA|nr:hypothetical protein ANCCAN_21113 [Ancylostoma caninum]
MTSKIRGRREKGANQGQHREQERAKSRRAAGAGQDPRRDQGRIKNPRAEGGIGPVTKTSHRQERVARNREEIVTEVLGEEVVAHQEIRNLRKKMSGESDSDRQKRDRTRSASTKDAVIVDDTSHCIDRC